MNAERGKLETESSERSWENSVLTPIMLFFFEEMNSRRMKMDALFYGTLDLTARVSKQSRQPIYIKESRNNYITFVSRVEGSRQKRLVKMLN